MNIESSDFWGVSRGVEAMHHFQCPSTVECSTLTISPIANVHFPPLYPLANAVHQLKPTIRQLKSTVCRSWHGNCSRAKSADTLTIKFIDKIFTPH
jgi:hypothetical protein